MIVLKERDLEVAITGAVDARKFDGDEHGLSHCMKAVDFIVELDDRYLFIEFTDPGNPKAREKNRKRFMREFEGCEFDEELKHKYRDSFLYEWASGRADKPVDYLVLVGLDNLTSDELDAKSDDLERKLPVQIPKSVQWPRPFVRSCAVFNMASWNRNLPDYPVSRRSNQP